MAHKDRAHAAHLSEDLTHVDSTQSIGTASDSRFKDLDVLVVGAGFAGIYQLKHLRDRGYKVLLVDNGSDFGGTWFWNRYPGLRVDTAAPQYLFSDPELLKDWEYTQRFPGGSEIRKYCNYVAEKWDLRKDTKFDTYIKSASWDNRSSRWLATAADGKTYNAKFLVLCTGCLIQEFIPKWEGVDKYKGTFFHPTSWPHEDPGLRGKKVAIIGTGATGVQLIQELSKVAGELTVFQRTPNTAIPMRQVDYDDINKPFSYEEVKALLGERTKCFGGFEYTFIPRKCFDDTPEQRLEVYEKLWQAGDFKFWLATYSDTLFSEEANRESYNFWRNKTRAKINDPKVADILAPMKPAYAFGTKRIPLEQGYFETFNEPHVKLINLRATPIERLTEKGIKTSAGEMEFDTIIAATGFDALTGSLTRIDIKGKDGTILRDYWKDGVKTHLGLTSHGFPNLFFQYGPQAPSALCNGPTCAEMQGNWVIDTIDYCRDHGYKSIEATKASEQQWRQTIFRLAGASLLPETNSWYYGDNIPGKPREPIVYIGGVPRYYATLNEVHDSGYEGFVFEDGLSSSKL